jgi:hypothetical protein
MVKSKEYLLQIIKNGADKKQIDVKTPIEVAIQKTDLKNQKMYIGN